MQVIKEDSSLKPTIDHETFTRVSEVLPWFDSPAFLLTLKLYYLFVISTKESQLKRIVLEAIKVRPPFFVLDALC